MPKEIEFDGEVKEEEKEEEEEPKKEITSFHIKSKPSVLKETIALCKPIATEIKMKIKPTGIKIVAVDAAHVSMIDMTLNNSAFEEFSAEDDIEIGIDMDKLSDLLRIPCEKIIIDYNPEERRAIVKLDHIIRKMGLIDINSMPDPKLPALQLPAKITMSNTEMSKSIMACEQISDHLKLSASKDELEISAEGDYDEVNIPLKKEMLINLDSPDKYNSMYSIEYMKDISKGAKDQIRMSLGTDTPIQIDYKFADDCGSVTYILAPRIEEE